MHFYKLGSPVVPFYPFPFWVPLLKPNSGKKGTLIIKGLLGNLVREVNFGVDSGQCVFSIRPEFSQRGKGLAPFQAP